MSHTPGPWRVENDSADDYWVVTDAVRPDGFPKIVAGPAMDKDDAQLIAAAPELMEAIRAIRDNEPFCWEKARDAIAKAEGREQEVQG